MSLLDDLRRGPVDLDSVPNRNTLQVKIHQLRERGYGIRLRKTYELMYEPKG